MEYQHFSGAKQWWQRKSSTSNMCIKKKMSGSNRISLQRHLCFYNKGVVGAVLSKVEF